MTYCHFSGQNPAQVFRPHRRLLWVGHAHSDRQIWMGRCGRGVCLGRIGCSTSDLVSARPTATALRGRDPDPGGCWRCYRHTTFCINSLAHWTGLQPYTEEVTARGNYVRRSSNHGSRARELISFQTVWKFTQLLALLTSGEGNHKWVANDVN